MAQTKRRKSRRSSVALPWEERGSFWRRLLAGPRWKVALVALALVWVGSLLWRAADERARLGRAIQRLFLDIIVAVL